MTDSALRVTTHLMHSEEAADDLMADIGRVVSRDVCVVYPATVMTVLIAKFESEDPLQVALNHNIAEVRKEFDALSNFHELGLLPRTDDGSETRYINSAGLLALRNPSMQKAYENLFRTSLNVVAISAVFEKRTGEALPIPIVTSPHDKV